MTISKHVRQLIRHGARIRHPETVFIEASVDLSRVSPDITIHPGCRISGEKTSIGPGCVLGAEEPATINDCRLAANVEVKGGFVADAVFLEGASAGSGSHIRPATLLEEQASCAHSVGLKQTILMPFVTMGSLANFCDCLMAGGTDDRYHSEVGSSYIHFNFTPHYDKATPSLMGDVPRGVMLDQPPIFLGGQGGLLGPSRVEFGTVIAAGSIIRKDILRPNRLISSQGNYTVDIPYDPMQYRDIHRTVLNNLIYIGNLHALRNWYLHVRARFMKRDPFNRACYEGALDILREMVDERKLRLTQLAENIRAQGRKDQLSHKRFLRLFPVLTRAIPLDPGPDVPSENRDRLLAAVERLPASISYLDGIRALSAEARQAGTEWLQSIVDSLSSRWQQ